MLGLFLAVFLWGLYPRSLRGLILPYGVMVFLAVSRLGVYVVLGSGWASNSKYALLGSLRGVAQTISYEVSMALTLLCCLSLYKVLNLYVIMTDFFMVVLFIIPFVFFA